MSGVALVTGAAGGIGSAIAARLVEAGWDVVAADRAAGAPAIGTTWSSVDLRDDGAVRATVDAAVARGPLRALVCCAGVISGTPITHMEDGAVAAMIDVNLLGTVRTCRAAAPHLGEGSSVVLIGSIAASAGGAPGVSIYGATKAALEGFSRALACELGPRGVRVNVVAPGFVDAPMSGLLRSAPDGEARLTRQVPLGRLARPGEIADVVEFLVGPRSSYVTGTVVVVDGGVLAR